MKLVIVDTPAQAKHVVDVLDESWQVEPCFGGVRDLPSDKLGIDLLHDFQPSYALLPRKGNLVRRLMRAISNAEAIYVAMPPGRKGETMAWHILALAPTLKDKQIYRTPLTALTPEAIRSAFASPRELNLNWVDAEISRRMIDQLIRFLVSPLANQALDTNLTVSRAALVGLGILEAHERKMQAFQPETAWAVKAHFVVDSTEFEATLYSTHGKALKFKTREQADSLTALLTNATIWVDRAGSRITHLDAPRPYTPMTLIAEAEGRLGIQPTKTLELIQTLYEAGWLIYPADKTSALSPQTMEVAQDFIRKAFGHEYASSSAFPADGLIQSAYVYPSEIDRLPEQLPGDGAALYGLIWHRFVASLMSSVQARQTVARILVGTSPSKPFPLEFRAQAQQILFEGWHRAAPNEADAENAVGFPNLADGRPVTLKAVQIEEALPAPLPRMTPSALMTALGVQDVDRSAEYAAALQILLESDHAELEEGRLIPTEQGSALAAFIEAHFGTTFSARQSVDLEHAFEQVAAGEVKRLDLLRTFWTQFGPLVNHSAQIILNHEAERPNRTPERHRPIVLRPLVEG